MEIRILPSVPSKKKKSVDRKTYYGILSFINNQTLPQIVSTLLIDERRTIHGVILCSYVSASQMISSR